MMAYSMHSTPYNNNLYYVVDTALANVNALAHRHISFSRTSVRSDLKL